VLRPAESGHHAFVLNSGIVVTYAATPSTLPPRTWRAASLLAGV